MAETFFKETDGKSVDVTIDYTISGERPILVDNWVGLPSQSGDSGDTIALVCDGGVYQWQAPSGLSLSVGNIVYVDISETGSANEVPDSAFTTTATADTLPLFKVLTEKNASNWCDVKLINDVLNNFNS